MEVKQSSKIVLLLKLLLSVSEYPPSAVGQIRLQQV